MDVDIVRLKRAGHRFEVACNRKRLNEYYTLAERGAVLKPVESVKHRKSGGKKGKKKGQRGGGDSSSDEEGGPQAPPLEKIVFHPQVFTNAYKREIATNAALIKAFGTADFSENAIFIVQHGEVVEHDSDRLAKRRDHRGTVEKYHAKVIKMLSDRFTGLSPEPEAVLAALRSTPDLPEPYDDAHITCAYAASRLCVKEDAWRRVCRKVGLVFPEQPARSPAMTKLNVALHDLDGLVVEIGQETLPPAKASPPPEAEKPAEGETKEKAEEGPKEDAAEPKVKAVAPNRTAFILLVDETMFTDPPAAWTAAITAVDGVVKPLTLTNPDDTDRFTKYEFACPPGFAPPAPSTAHHFHSHPAIEDAVGHPSSGGKSKAAPEKATHQAGGGGGGTTNYEAMTHKVLQDMCKKRGLSTGGKKKDLVDRLDADDEVVRPAKR